MLDEAKAHLASALCLWTGFQGAAMVVSVCLCLRLDKDWHFDKIGVVEHRTVRKNRLILYSDIQAILVCSAVDRNFYPLRDKYGMPRSVIVIYNNRDEACSYMRPDSIFVLPVTHFGGVLSYSFFSLDKLRTLMEKTKATVFVSQKIYEDNKNQLDIFFSKQENRVLIAVSNDAAKGRFMSPDGLR